jgi:hypothetical protein
MNIKMLKAALAGLVLSVSGFANAGLIYSDTNITGNFWARTLGTSTMISGLGPVQFHAQEFFTDTSGLFDFSSIQSYDGYLHLYELVFNPTSQSTNLLAANDDGVSGIGSSDFSYVLISMRQYILITSSFSAGENGTFTNTIDIAQGRANVFAGKVTDVPEPTTLAIFALGIMGLASRRFKKQS